MIQLGNLYRGYPEGEISDAATTAAVWDSLGLSEIPEEDLEEAFRRALNGLTRGEVFGALEVREAYKAIRLERASEAAAAARATALAEEVCYYCAGTGWQTIAQKSPLSGNENTYLRPCTCSKAPSKAIESCGTYRDKAGEIIAPLSAEPLREPEYCRRPRTEIWREVALTEMEKISRGE